MTTPTQFDLQPTLVGETITLLPLRADDFESLYEAAADPLLWEQHPASCGSTLASTTCVRARRWKKSGATSPTKSCAR